MSRAEGRRLRIGFLTAEDARDPRSWSGTPHYMSRALERHCGEVVHLGPVVAVREQLGRVRSGLSRLLRGRRRAYHHSLALSREYARRFAPRIREDLDVIVAPFASTEIAFLETDVPIVYTSDVTFERMVGYHPGFSGLDAAYIEEGNEVERRALERAALVLYPSEWAADSALGFYGITPAKVHVISYGANFDALPDREAIEPAKSLETCRILFVGVNWERKGGTIAYQATRLLRERGLHARFVACGSVPPSPLDSTFARVIPRLDKRNADDVRELSRLMLEANFLVLPTMNDCFAMVVAEASGHGAPSIASRTGGVPSSVRDGENGVLLPVGAGPADYADVIETLFLDRERYRSLVYSSRTAFEGRLNWNVWARRVGALLGSIHHEPMKT